LWDMKQRGSQTKIDTEMQNGSENVAQKETSREHRPSSITTDTSGETDDVKDQCAWALKNEFRSHTAQPMQEALEALQAVEQNLLTRLERLENRVMECENRKQHCLLNSSMLADDNRHPHVLTGDVAGTAIELANLPRCRWFNEESQTAHHHHGAAEKADNPQHRTTSAVTTCLDASQLHRDASDLLELLEVQRMRFEAVLRYQEPLTMARVAGELIESKSVAAELCQQLKRTACFLTLVGVNRGCPSESHRDQKVAPACGHDFCPDRAMVHRAGCPASAPLPTPRHWLQPRVSSSDSTAETSVPVLKEVVAHDPCVEHVYV